MKALEKDRSRRYETANGFARDVHATWRTRRCRRARRRPCIAFASSPGRHQTALATASLILITLVLGTADQSGQAVRATEAKDATQAQLRLTQDAEREASQRLYRSMVAQARASRLSRRIGSASRPSTPWPKLSGSPAA